MDRIKNKKNTLLFLFIRQVIRLSFSILMEVAILAVLFMWGVQTNRILPANYAERYLEKNEKKISQTMPFDDSLIPHTCRYGIFDTNGNYQYGTLRQKKIMQAKELIHSEAARANMLFKITRSDGYCVVSYDILAHFSSPGLHKLIPQPEYTLIVLFLVIFLGLVMLYSFQFERILRKALSPVVEEIRSIKEREITEDKKNSQIKEFHEIIDALYDMKIALIASLKSQWEAEQQKRLHISALAHDIKTPLTIIRGNAELVREEGDLEQVRKMAMTIEESCNRMERYLALLLEETKGGEQENRVNKILLSTLIGEMVQEGRAFLKTVGINLHIEDSTKEEELLIDKDSLQRAVMNLIRNAAEHTREKKEIALSFFQIESRLIIQVKDYGRGFTKEAIKHGRELFFTEYHERGEHYGLGLFYVNNIALRYQGSLSLQNNAEYTGATVTLQVTLPK
ncbi:MAG: two-component system, OmpR family, lantibiotic biosynthesis sensor histidine kinase NisK/SpaK [Clostridiales bacterium]|nr:two-component system, OmpR family, lantibiotic biosynthesis sensor histidine kinase NisK/SpaK [Clostridiales bacterium]